MRHYCLKGCPSATGIMTLLLFKVGACFFAPRMNAKRLISLELESLFEAYFQR
jgi:hypothetical protein